MSNRTARSTCALALLAMLALIPVRAQEPVGGEFRVNPGLIFSQNPDVASPPYGGFIVVWDMSAGIYGKRYDASGNVLGSEFLVGPSQGLSHPTIDTAADGSFVVTWSGPSSTGTEILGRRFDASGNPLGGVFLVNEYTTGLQSFPVVAADSAGAFVVVWLDSNRDGSFGGIFGRRFDATGNALGDDFQVNTYTTDGQSQPAVASTAGGEFVVVWQSDKQVGTTAAVFGQRYDASGAPVGGEFLVNSYTSAIQSVPDVTLDAAGNFVVVWTAVRGGAGTEIYGQRFDASGAFLGSDFHVNTYTTDTQSWPEIASADDGSFVVTWESEGQDGHLRGVFGQQFAADGTPVGVEFQANTHTVRRQHDPAIASDADGDFVVVWGKADASKGTHHVDGQRYAGPGLYLSVSGTCPGPVTATIVNAPANSEVALVAAANTNGFVKQGTICPGTELEIGEPFKLPPTWVIVDGQGRGTAQLSLGANECWVQALETSNCSTSDTVRVP